MVIRNFESEVLGNKFTVLKEARQKLAIALGGFNKENMAVVDAVQRLCQATKDFDDEQYNLLKLEEMRNARLARQKRLPVPPT
jgi:hypothetical protein